MSLDINYTFNPDKPWKHIEKLILELIEDYNNNSVQATDYTQVFLLMGA